MFPANYFGPRYFAARYWPKVGANAGSRLSTLTLLGAG